MVILGKNKTVYGCFWIVFFVWEFSRQSEMTQKYLVGKAVWILLDSFITGYVDASLEGKGGK